MEDMPQHGGLPRHLKHQKYTERPNHQKQPELPDEPTKLDDPHRCWFCTHNNPSYLETCEDCHGSLIPTRDQQQNLLDWYINSYGSNTLLPLSEPSNEYPARLQALIAANRNAAISIGDATVQVLVVRYPSGEIRFTIKDPSDQTTYDWHADNGIHRQLFHNVVNAIV